MADRLPQYSMIPNFNAGLMQQQQQQQQLNQQQAQQVQQQQQQDVHPPLPGFPDQGRMWQQIQHMQQFRPGGGDINPQANSQMMDLLRSQSLARVQGQQQQQQLNNQQFGLGVQQMGNMGGGAGNGQQQSQSQPFPDSASTSSPQINIPSSFSGTGLPNAPAMQQSMSRNAMLQAFQTNGNQPGHNPSVTRQLERMLAQNQPQNGSINHAQRLEHQRQQQQQQQAQHQQQLQAMTQSSPAELFTPGMVDRRPSPAHSNMQGPNLVGGATPQQHPQQPPQMGRRMTMAELNERAAALRAHIQAQEQVFAQLNAQRPMSPDPNYLNKMRQLSNDMKQKKEYLAKMTQAMQSMGANMSAMAQAAHQQANGSGQAAWNFTSNANAQIGHGQPPNQSQPGQTNIQPSPSNMHAQIQQGNHLVPPGVVARSPSGQPPHQPPHSVPGGGPPLGRPFPNQMSPSMNPQFPFPMNNASTSSPPVAVVGVQGGMQLPPPLEKNRFESAYKSYSMTKGVKHEPRLMNVEGREIDLYMLHTNVMQEGGWGKVHNKELWNVIGGRMGFVSFPGTDTEPAKSGPGVAQRLAQVYKEYLAGFDQVYINSVIDSRRKMQAAAAVQAQAAAAAANGNGGPSQSQPQSRGLLNAHQMQMVIGYANQSVEELRRQGVQERIIQFVETNRAHLQRTVMEQGMFRGQFQNQGLRPPEQHGMQGVTGSPFQNSVTHQNATPASGPHPPFMPQQQNGLLPMQGSNFMDNRQSQIPPQQHPHQQNGNPVFRGTKEQAMAFILKTKRDFQTSNLPNMRGVELPVEQRAEYNTLLQQLQHVAQEIDNKLPMYLFVLKSEDSIRKLIAIIMTVNQQRVLSNSSNPRYIVGLDILRNMMAQVHSANDAIQAYLATQINRNPQPQQGQPQPQQPLLQAPGNINMPPNNHLSPEMNRPPTQSLPHQQMPPQGLAPPSRPPVSLRPPPAMKKASASTPSPTPPYSASTPVPSAPTPTQTASSPQAPKSPKGKAPAKPKNPPKRRPSVKNPPAPTPAPPAAEQAQTPTATTGGNVKRPREEDVSNTFGASPVASGSSAANEPSPPKRVKTEWDGPPSDILKKKNEAVENVKTEEDASAFLEQMTELIKMAGEGQESLSSDISETLDMILKGYGTIPDSSEVALGLSSFGGLGESSISTSTKPPADEFVEFFDFSSFVTLDEDNGDDSKAPTPELVPSSSTNPSPESGSEADAAHHALLSSTEPKTEELPDLLRLGPWKEIDGGESAYYQSGGFNFNSPMPTQEQAWAIFGS